MAPPNYVVNFADIQFSQGAMSGRPYPFSGPGDCPNAPTPAPPGQFTGLPISWRFEGQSLTTGLFLMSQRPKSR